MKHPLFISDELGSQWQQTPFLLAQQQQGEIFRDKEGRRTLRFEYNQKGYFLKLHEGVGWQEIIKNLLQLRLPVIGATNEWQAIQALPNLGIDTLTAVGFGVRGINPAKQLSFLITEELIDVVSLEDYCASWKANPPSFVVKHALIKRVAEIARIMHSNGINHRDFYLCHFLMRNNTQHKPLLFLMDLHRAQIRKKVPLRWLIKDLAGLWYSALDIGLNKKDCYRFIKYYEDASLRSVLVNKTSFWLEVNRKALNLYQKDFSAKPDTILFETEK